MEPIQNNQMNSGAQMGGGMPTSSQAPSGNGEKKVGPIIAVLIIVLVLIIAALYLFASRLKGPAIPADGATMSDDTAAMSDAERQVEPVTGNSDDVQSLQADLDASADGLETQNF